MTLRTYISFLFLSIVAYSYADDKTLSSSILAETMPENISFVIDKDMKSESSLAISAMSAPAAESKIPQLGTGSRNFAVNAHSFQRLSEKDCVWGNAGYENGRKYDVIWNETSDFLSVYPYVLGDPRGGDLKYEQYLLNGGYSRNIDKFNAGFKIGYRALSEYRDRDPRPNNTVADLNASLAISYHVNPSNTLGVSFNFGKYKQTSELVYLNELGAQKEYQMTGLGNDFARFSGSNNNSFYKGYNWGGTIDLSKSAFIGSKNLLVSAGYDNSYKERILSDLNRLPLNELRVSKFQSMISLSDKNIEGKINFKYSSRKGNDNLFGEATGNVYPQIGTRKQYTGEELFLDIEGRYTHFFSPAFNISGSPIVAYTSFSSQHNDTGNKLSTIDFEYGAKAEGVFIIGRKASEAGKKTDKAHFSVLLTRRTNLDGKLILNNVCESSLADVFLRINSYFSQGETNLKLGLAYDRAISASRTLTLDVKWERNKYLEKSNSDIFSASLILTL